MGKGCEDAESHVVLRSLAALSSITGRTAKPQLMALKVTGSDEGVRRSHEVYWVLWSSQRSLGTETVLDQPLNKAI
jgi:hypothetical protein